MRSGLLLGSDHTQLGAVSALSEGRAGIALSRGGAPKTYRYQDPNEDACLFAYEGESWLVAVADGHWGAAGSAIALERIVEQHAPRWLAPPALAAASLEGRWVDEAPEVLADLNHTLLAAGGEDLVGRTTLALCVCPEGGNLLVLAAGDSHVFALTQEGLQEHCALPSGGRPFYLGDPALERRHLQAGARAQVVYGSPGAVMLATDGLSEAGIGVDDPLSSTAESLRRAAEQEEDLGPLVAARSLAETALAAQQRNRSGDNVAIACLWWSEVVTGG